MLEEINTTMFLIVEKAELVTINHSSLIVCCYHQLSSMDVTLFTSLDNLLDRYHSILPVICGISLSTNLLGHIPATPQVLVQLH